MAVPGIYDNYGFGDICLERSNKTLGSDHVDCPALRATCSDYRLFLSDSNMMMNSTPRPRHCSIWTLIVKPREIHFLRFCLEAYEGIATVTTLQPQLGLIRLNIAPGCEEDVEKILSGEADRIQYRFTATVPDQ